MLAPRAVEHTPAFVIASWAATAREAVGASARLRTDTLGPLGGVYVIAPAVESCCSFAAAQGRSDAGSGPVFRPVRVEVPSWQVVVESAAIAAADHAEALLVGVVLSL